MYVAVIQFHGKIDLYKPEPGLDNDTGGEIIYVLQACEELAKYNYEVKIFTRFLDENNQYSIKQQRRNGVELIRLEMRENQYRLKEELWSYIWDFIDSCLNYFIEDNRHPNIFIGNYADGGTIAFNLARILSIPFIFIPHSLGRMKLENLLSSNQYRFDELDIKYNFSKRIFHEEHLFKFADTIIVSSEHEKHVQCSMYENFLATKVKVIPPGTNIQLVNHCNHVSFKRKPIIIVARLSKTKNLVSSLDILYQSEWLRDNAEVIVATTSTNFTHESEEIHKAIQDRCYKYGGFATFLQLNSQEDIFCLFHCAKEAKGIYFNPSLIEPFGLTALEAASYGLPVILTDNGGTADIIKNVNIGYLVNVKDENDIISKICFMLNDNNYRTWKMFSDNGFRNISQTYSWSNWVKKIETLLSCEQQLRVPHLSLNTPEKNAKMIVTELYGTLVKQDSSSEYSFKIFIERCPINLYLIYLIDISLEDALDIIKKCELPYPNMFISYCGTHMYSLDCLKNTYVVVKEWVKLNKDYFIKFPSINTNSMNSQVLECRIPVKNCLHKYETIEDSIIKNNEAPDIPINHLDDMKRIIMQTSELLSLRWLLRYTSTRSINCIVCCDLRNFKKIAHGSIKFVVVNNYDIQNDDSSGMPFIYYSKAKFASGIIEGIKFYLNLDF